MPKLKRSIVENNVQEMSLNIIQAFIKWSQLAGLISKPEYF